MKLSTMRRIVTAAQVSLNHGGRDNIQERQITADMLENMIVEVELLVKSLHVQAKLTDKHMQLVTQWLTMGQGKIQHGQTLVSNCNIQARATVHTAEEFFDGDKPELHNWEAKDATRTR